MSQQQHQRQVPTQHTAAVLLAEQEAQAIDWSDEKLDLQAAFAKIRAVLAARNANANAVLQALTGGGTSGSAAGNTDTLSTEANAAVAASNATASDTIIGGSDGSKITDSLSHMPIGSASTSSIGIYYDLHFFFVCSL